MVLRPLPRPLICHYIQGEKQTEVKNLKNQYHRQFAATIDQNFGPAVLFDQIGSNGSSAIIEQAEMVILVPSLWRNRTINDIAYN